MITVQAAEYSSRCVDQGAAEKRAADRRPIAVPGRLVWKDREGTTRMATVVTRDVSEHGALVECLSGSAIPLYRLVDFHLDRSERDRGDLPMALRRSQVLAAVYRIGPYSPATGTPETYALRLLVKPERRDRGMTRTADQGGDTVSDGGPRTMTA